ncbi:Ig-like domain-containing protein [Marinobacter mobilis]|uniref:Ig-like domain-containing protein n=1 Tax=Marinobacter mobilis TaxID=488533 RepID=A0A1H2XH48_9GAMM|nr:Ig-like domain-containing protein [Marinobacter mobilis]SDW92106.1 Ig-like domain-containing protein [Marinobacter mobilis]
MKYNKILALTPVLLLAACGGGEEQTLNAPLIPGSVIYSYPADGQTEVSPKADVVLRFSHAITDENLTSKIRISDGTNTVPFTVTAIDGGRSLKLSPVGQFQTGTNYTITFAESLLAAGNRAVATPNAIGANGVQFSTRAGMSGVAGLDNLSSNFAVADMIPSANGFFRPMDFSTFRLRLTQPVHPDWQRMGGSITLRDGNGDEVPATVLVDGRRITVDPCTTNDPAQCGLEGDALTPGASYSIDIANLPNMAGDTLDYSSSFTPKDTSPTVILFQDTIDSGLLAGLSEADAQRSVLNGEIINGVTLNSVLQGIAGPSQQTGGLYAELGYGPSFPGDEPVPLRVPKGSLLTSSSLDVRINGTVPIINPDTNSIQTTGDIRVTMLSDATGYLYPNPYSNSGEAPRHVKLYMDVSMNTVEAQPNASLSQDLLGVELSGIAIVRDGILNIDAIGMVEPNLLGQEFTDSTIAFHIEANTNADVQLDALDNRTFDTTGPQLVSWMPGPDDALPSTRQAMQRPGDPIVLNFDEALDGDSLAGGFTLLADGVPVDDANLRRKLDGTVVALNPVGGLRHGVDYALQINGSLTDLAGNSAMSETLSFALPELASVDRSPFALTTYPGFPCVTTGLDLDAGTHGQCVDAAPGGPAGQVMPITTLPQDRAIVVVFSQSMDLDSIRNGETFVVEQINPDGSVAGQVPGHLEKNNQRIRFYPDSPWQVGTTYRYTMASSTAVDDCSTALCSEDGYPLQTDILVDPEDVGGPDMAIYFRGTETASSVYTPLRNLPVRDTNSNYLIEGVEPFAHASDGNGGFLPSENAAKLAVVDQQANALGIPVGASVGCAASESCPENKFIYQTYGLNTEVMGPAYDAEGNNIGVRVLLYPTMLATTSASVFLDGFGENATGPQVIRMTYGEPTEDNPLGLVEGLIVEGEDGKPTFKTLANLTLDAPNLQLPIAALLAHDLYSKPFSLDLSGPILFFDDGRMQIEQRNQNQPPINVNVEVEIPLLGGFIDFFQCVSLGNSLADCLSGAGTDSGDISIPLVIPAEGIWLNFVSFAIKDIPEQY